MNDENELQIFKLDNQDSRNIRYEYYDYILIVAKTGYEAKQLSIVKYNPDGKGFIWPCNEEQISCEEIGIPFSNFKYGDVIAECYVSA